MPACPPAHVFIACLIMVGGGSFHLGYHEILVNPTFDIFQKLLNDTAIDRYGIRLSQSASNWLWSFATSSLPLGQIFGCFLLIPLSRRMGRVRGIAITNAILLICIPLFILSRNSHFELFVIGRFVTGIALGVVMGLQALFLKEIGSVEYAGMINTFAALVLEFGANAAAILGTDTLLGSHERWHFLFYLLIPSLVISLIYHLFFAHETPFDLLNRKRPVEAKKSITFYHAHKNEHERQKISNAINNELLLYTKKFGLADVLRLKPARNALFLSVTMNLAIMFTGVLAISFYGTELLEKSGMGKTLASWLFVAIFSVCLWALLLSTCIVDRIPRRVLAVGGCMLMGLLNLAITALLVPYGHTGKLWVGITFAGILGVWAFLYGLTVGNIAWFIAVELSAPSYANVVSSIAIAAQACAAFVVPFIFYPVNDLIGAYSFLIMFALPLLACGIYFYFALPETLHRRLGDILLDLGATVEELAVLDQPITKDNNADNNKIIMEITV